jgi:hypothetical protein
MHAERTVPPIKNCDAIKLLYCCNHCLLVSFIAAMNDNITAKNWASNIETVKGANIAARLTNGGAQPTKGAWDVVELTVKCD